METITILALLFILFCARAHAQSLQHCQDRALRCQDGVCVDFQFSCDTETDCFRFGNKRVRDSNGQLGCDVNEFECPNKRCVPLSWVCDAEEDCEDGSDERDCMTLDSIPITCPAKLLRPYLKTFKKHNIQNVSITCTSCISSGQQNTALKLKIYPELSTVYVRVGYTLVLQCRDEGIMRVPVLWRRKGKGLFSTRTAMTRGGRLEIQEADITDSGTYVCQSHSRHLLVRQPDTEVTISVVVTNDTVVTNQDIFKGILFNRS
ncbi:PREDICTED: basement membrane-specific heparan sulfate proteoglycan core protein-like isoform X2 [Papilio polytes]|uniref:basement membrane-specific heparan sulfate proteoglycan core protein-like isoform X2 n=1 Tax=Papilio polytes TaxID=76194 RepID=UPI000675C777|nr:PREDICTED: basement membrane-specific heparan sulfate proteoglycan core protein-like isoform X2 [Papilio polytes]